MADQFRPIIVDGQPILCPFCGLALREGVLHSCADMRADVALAPRAITVWQFRLATIIAAALVLVAITYFAAHVLVAAGVGCPGTA